MNGTVHFGGLQLEGELVRDHMALLTKRLSQAVSMIHPKHNPARDALRLKVQSPTYPRGLPLGGTSAAALHVAGASSLEGAMC